jgi:hypothetical protein
MRSSTILSTMGVGNGLSGVKRITVLDVSQPCSSSSSIFKAAPRMTNKEHGPSPCDQCSKTQVWIQRRQVEERDVLTCRCQHDASRATTIPSWPNRSRTLAALSVRLRSEIDLDSLFAEPLAVVDQTIQPTRASLWPRPSAHAWPPSGSTLDETDIRRERRSPAHHPSPSLTL